MEINLGRVLEQVPAMVWVAENNGQIVFVNRRWTKYTGLDLETSRGTSWDALLSPDDVARVLERWQIIQASGDAGEFQARLRRADGHYRLCAIHFGPLHDGDESPVTWCGVATDIQDIRRAVDTVGGQLDLQQIVDSVPVPVAVTAPSGAVEGLNKATLTYFGKTFEELKGWQASDVVHPDDLDRTVSAQLEAHQKGISYNVESRHRRADGIYRWHNVLGLPLRDSEGSILRWFHLLIDVDDRKRAQEALRLSEANLAAVERDLRLTIDTIPVFVAIYTADGTWTFVNRRWQEYMGLSLAEATGPSARKFPHFHPDDVERHDKAWLASLASGEPLTIEVRVRRADGRYRWHLSQRVPLRDDHGNVVRWYSVGIDVDDKKRAEEALQASGQEARLIVDSIPGGIEVLSPEGKIEEVNEHVERYFGKSAEQLKLEGMIDLVHPDDRQRVLDTAAHSIATGEPYDAEQRFLGAEGKYRWFHVRGLPYRDTSGKVARWYALHIDIDEQKAAEEALRQSERKFKLALDTIPALAWAAETDGAAEFFNQHYLDYVGLSSEQAQGWGWTVAVHPDDLNGLATTWQAILATGMPGEAEARLRGSDGEYRWFLFRTNPLRDENGALVRWYGTNVDIEDRKRAENLLRAKERELGLIINTIPTMAWSARPDGSPEFFNQHYLHYVGLSIGQSADWVPAIDLSEYWDLTASVHPDDVDRLDATWKAILATGEAGETEVRIRRFDGKYRWFLFRANPLRDDGGNIVKWYGTHTDIHDRKRTEDALKRSEAFLAEGQYLARMGNLSWNVSTGRIIWSEQLYRIFQFKPRTRVTLDLIAERVHPEDISLMEDMILRAQRGDNDFEYQHRIILPDGSVKYLHLIAHRARNDPSQIEYIGAVLDITQRRLSEDALEKVRSELAQVTRMMSLGVLTASIAHEVNQPLSGIITNASTCLRMLAAEPPNIDGARETARRTIRDGNRAADVITRLRTLFRKRTATIEPVDLNEATREVMALCWGDLQRRRISVHTDLTDELPPVGGDRVQLQQVILNLLRNATDAMSNVDDRPRQLWLSTKPDEDGAVRLSVRDTGIGFDPDDHHRLFDAFFTTKSEGMGIGLSVSRSIIESHEGRLWAEANDGPGATFSFSIPQFSLDRGGAIQTSVTSNAARAVGNS